MNSKYQRKWMYPRRQSANPDQPITGIRQRQAIKKRYGVNPWLPNVYGNTQLLFSQKPKVAILGSFGWMQTHADKGPRYRDTVRKFTAHHMTMVLPVDNTQDSGALWETGHRHVPTIGVIASNFQDVPANAKNEAYFGGEILRNRGVVMSPFSNKRPVDLSSSGPYNWRNVWMSQFSDMLYIPHATFSKNLKTYLAKHPGTSPAHYAEITHRPVFKEPGANAATYVHYKTGKPILYTRQNNDPKVNIYLKRQSGAVNTGAYFYGLGIQERQGVRHIDYNPADSAKIINQHVQLDDPAEPASQPARQNNKPALPPKYAKLKRADRKLASQTDWDLKHLKSLSPQQKQLFQSRINRLNANRGKIEAYRKSKERIQMPDDARHRQLVKSAKKDAQNYTTPGANNRLMYRTYKMMQRDSKNEVRLGKMKNSTKTRQQLVASQARLKSKILYNKLVLRFAGPGLKHWINARQQNQLERRAPKIRKRYRRQQRAKRDAIIDSPEDDQQEYDSLMAEIRKNGAHAKHVVEHRDKLQDHGRWLYHHPKQLKPFRNRYLNDQKREKQLEALNNGHLPNDPKSKQFQHRLTEESWIMSGVYYEPQDIQLEKQQQKIDQHEKYVKTHPQYSIVNGKQFDLSKGGLDVLPPENATQNKSGIRMQALPKKAIARFEKHLKLLNHNGIRVVTSENVHGSDLVPKTENKLKVPYGLYVNRKDLQVPKIKKYIAAAKANGGSVGVMNYGTDAKRASDVALQSEGLFLPRVTLKHSGKHYYPQEPSAKLALAAMKKANKTVFIDPHNNSKKANELMEKDGAVPIQSIEDAAYKRRQAKATQLANKYTKNLIKTEERLKHRHGKHDPKKPFLPVAGKKGLLNGKHKIALVSFGAMNSPYSKDYDPQKSRIQHAVNGLSSKKYTILTPLSTNEDEQTAVQQTIQDQAPAVGFIATTDPGSSLSPDAQELSYYEQKPNAKLQAKYKQARNRKAFQKAHPKLNEKDRQRRLKHYRARLNAYHYQPKAVVQATFDKNAAKSVKNAILSKHNKTVLQNASTLNVAKSLNSLALRKSQTNALINSSNAVLVLGVHSVNHKLVDDSLTHDAEPMLKQAQKSHKPIYFISNNNSQQARQVLESKYGAKPISSLIGQAAATHEHVNARKELDHSFAVYNQKYKGQPNKPLKHTSMSKAFDNLPDGDGKHPVTFDSSKPTSKPKKKDKGKGDDKGGDTPDF